MEQKENCRQFTPFKSKVWLSTPTMHGLELEYIKKAYNTNWMSTVGENINEAERLACEKIGCKYAVGLSAGTAALHMAVKLAGVKPGDRVFCSDMTFDATVNPVVYEGGVPVFIDTEYDTWNMDPVALEKAFELYPDVKVVVAAHLYGTPGKIDEIREICKRHGAVIIEDAAESLGATYKGVQTGTFGDYNAISFNGNKIITTGGGGAITAKNPSDLDYVKYLSTQAKDDALYYIHNEIGYNYRMTNVQAAIGVAQLELLSEFIQRKQKNYDTYQKCLKKIGLPQLLEFRQGTESNKWFYSFPIPKECAVEVRTLIESLQNEKIQTRPIWGLIHEQKPYQSDIAYEIEKAEEYSRCIINVPCSTNLTEEEIERVVKVLADKLDLQ